MVKWYGCEGCWWYVEGGGRGSYCFVFPISGWEVGLGKNNMWWREGVVKMLLTKENVPDLMIHDSSLRRFTPSLGQNAFLNGKTSIAVSCLIVRLTRFFFFF